MDTNKVKKLYIYSTLKCNLKCIHCNVSASPDRKEMLNLGIVRSLFGKYSFKNISEINITGGEPFLYKELDDLIEFISSKFPNVNITISTNGISVNTALLLKHVKTIHSINVSIDGMEREHDQLRGHGSFKKTIFNLTKLCEIDIAVKINTVISNVNFSSIQKFDRYMKEKFPQVEIRTIPLMPFGRAASGTNIFEHTALRSAEKLQRCLNCTLPTTLSVYPDGSLYKCYAEYNNSGIIPPVDNVAI